MKKCIIVVGGDIPNGELPLKIIADADYLICADSGANYIFSLGYIPDLIIGDMDSIDKSILSKYEQKGCEIRTFPPEKDASDTELAIQIAVEKNYKEIYLLAARGDRLDHSLANLFLLVPYFDQKINIRLVGDNYISYMSKKEEYIKGKSGDLVSLLPLSEMVIGITLTGFKYPLQKDTINMGSSWGISNILIKEKGKIEYEKGKLLIIHYIK